MPFLEAVRLALQTIRVQKLKSFFTLMGVMIGVTFLIAVVSIVGGMSRYMTDQVVGKIIGHDNDRLAEPGCGRQPVGGFLQLQVVHRALGKQIDDRETPHRVACIAGRQIDIDHPPADSDVLQRAVARS